MLGADPVDGWFVPRWTHAVDGSTRRARRWARKQAERYEATDGAEANDLRGRPVIVLTSLGVKTGKLRKTALMRVEHDGVYAVVASMGGAPRHPAWYHNLKAHPQVELQDGPAKRDYLAHEVGRRREGRSGGSGPSRPGRTTTGTRRRPTRQIPVFVLEPIEPR